MKKNQFNLTLRKLIMELKISILIILLSVSSVFAGRSYSQTAKISLDIKDKTLEQVMDEIERQSEFYFIFNQKQIDVNRIVDIQANNKRITDVLPLLFEGTDVNYAIIDRKILLTTDPISKDLLKKDLKINLNEEQQQMTVTGVVTDASTGEVIPGVNVVVKGTTIGTITDEKGKYSINVPDRNATLVFSFIGYNPQEILLGGRTLLNVALSLDVKRLEEIVVVGYGVQKKLNLTAAVDQVTSEVITNRPIPNITQGLKGVIPNLNINLLDGKPIQAPSFNIRGTTSIGQGGNALVLIDGVEGDPSLLNPNDIASISVLKDAAAASIYGARGAFGVVLITTKNPEKGRTGVQYSTNYSLKRPIKLPDYVTDGYTYVKMFVEAFLNGDGSFPQNINKTQKVSQAYLDEFKRRVESGQPYNTVEVDPVTGEYVYYASTDWYDLLYKDFTSSIEHNLAISGSSDKAAYLVSGRIMGQNGLFRYNTDDYAMQNLRAKGSVNIFKWLEVTNNSDYSHMSYHNPMNVGEGSGIWRNIADEGHPSAPLFNPDGTFSMSAAYTVGDFVYGKNGIDTKRTVIKNTTGATASFFNNKLRIKGDFTFQNTRYDRIRKRVQVPYSNKPGVIAYVGTKTNDLTYEDRKTDYLATNIYSEYENNFGNNHYLKFMIGYNFEQSTYNRLYVLRNGIIYPDAKDINLCLGQSIETRGGYQKWIVLGGFSRLNYSFKDRYLIEINARYDGSSKFPSNQRFAFFPSISAGWRVSKESFFKVSPKLVNDLKIRASYGSLGNGNIASYVYQEQFSISQHPMILNNIRPQYTRFPNILPEGLTWETATTFDVGIDFSMFSGRFNFSGDWYNRKTTDMYTIGLTLPAVFGATPPKGNYADLNTKGWELSVSWNDDFNVASKPFNYNLRLALSDYRSVVTKYNNPDKLLTDYYPGMVIGEIWGYVTEGFFIDDEDVANHAKQSPEMRASPTNIWYAGDVKFKDLNNDGYINRGKNTVDDPGDRIIIGNRTPRYQFGINLGADWSNIFFSAFIQGVGKQDWYPSTECEFFWGQYNRPYNNVPKWHLGNMWTPENPNAYLPRTMSRAASSTTSRELGVPQTKYLQNVAYVRLRNLQLGYSLPKQLISRIGAKDLKVYFSGENLWDWSPLYKLIGNHLDVENTGPSDQEFTSGNAGDGYNYPMLMSFSFGLSITF